MGACTSTSKRESK